MVRAGNRRAGGGGWLSTLLGVVVLTVGGFVVGLIAGVVSEEPELVVGHAIGESVEVAWSDTPETVRPTPERAESQPSEEPIAQVSSPPPPAPTAARSMPGPMAAAPRSAQAGSADYAIQVGAFSESRSAEGLAASLRGRGFPAQVHGGTADGRWRVRVGPLESSQEAERMARRLKSEERLPTWVLQEGSH